MHVLARKIPVPAALVEHVVTDELAPERGRVVRVLVLNANLYSEHAVKALEHILAHV